MLPGLIAEAPTQGVPPVECGSPTRPFLNSLPLGTWHLNVWTAQEREGCEALFATHRGAAPWTRNLDRPDRPLALVTASGTPGLW